MSRLRLPLKLIKGRVIDADNELALLVCEEVVTAINSYEDLEKRLAELEEKLYVPGVWRCDTCNFQVSKNVMNAANGTVGADRTEDIEGCPNDGMMMMRVTWEQYCTQLDAAFITQVEAREAAQKRIIELEAKVLCGLCGKAESDANHVLHLCESCTDDEISNVPKQVFKRDRKRRADNCTTTTKQR